MSSVVLISNAHNAFIISNSIISRHPGIFTYLGINVSNASVSTESTSIREIVLMSPIMYPYGNNSGSDSPASLSLLILRNILLRNILLSYANNIPINLITAPARCLYNLLPLKNNSKIMLSPIGKYSAK